MVFLIVIMSLVAVLLFARDKLAPKGKVNLRINEPNWLYHPDPTFCRPCPATGSFSLLPAAAEVHAGCANARYCRRRDILPTETGFFTRKEQRITGASAVR